MQGKSYKSNCTISRDELRLIRVLHTTRDGQTRSGEIICNRLIASDILEIFHSLYSARYPIEKIQLIDVYAADDELSMRDNNSSSFNFRYTSHTKVVSMHGQGLAIDINPLYNPYCKTVGNKKIVEPVTASAYLDRSQSFPYKIDHNDLAYRLFTEKGFIWGGDWKSVKDYQHFEASSELIQNRKRMFNCP